jgi:hypothetical protein
LVNDSPKIIYNNPKEKYIATLFDDVNELIIDGKTHLLYPHQLKVVEESANNTELTKVKATVLNAYFKGSYWLIEAQLNQQKIYFRHFKDLKKSANIFLEISTF